MKLINESLLFSAENIAAIERVRNATYVCDTEHKGVHVAVFYGAEPHPVSNSRYFALYRDNGGTLMITNGAFVEEQEIAGIMADNGDVIYSAYRHHFNKSPDGSVFIDGGREYTRSSGGTFVTLLVRDGVMRILEDIK